ncbi:histone H2A-like [Phyllobates terribilis]|uniref:histone H2A-like n=1 Tax=Phyllobates terribilis TaxID=111132 RepID=UPI003CCAC286
MSRKDRRRKCRTRARSSRTSRAGLMFPVGRIHRYLRKGNFGKRVSANASVFLAAALQFMTREILFIAGYEALSQNRLRIQPHDLQKAMHADVELDKLLKNVILPQGGVVCFAPLSVVYTALVEIFPLEDP